MVAILDLRQNLRWPRSIFQIVWSKVHESTEKTLTGKKGSFYLARPLLQVDQNLGLIVAARSSLPKTRGRIFI